MESKWNSNGIERTQHSFNEEFDRNEQAKQHDSRSIMTSQTHMDNQPYTSKQLFTSAHLFWLTDSWLICCDDHSQSPPAALAYQ